MHIPTSWQIIFFVIRDMSDEEGIQLTQQMQAGVLAAGSLRAKYEGIWG